MSDGRRARAGQREIGESNPLAGFRKGDTIWAIPNFAADSVAMRECKVSRVLLGRLNVSGKKFRRGYVLAFEEGTVWARTAEEARRIELDWKRGRLAMDVQALEAVVKSSEFLMASEERHFALRMKRLRAQEAAHKTRLELAREALAAFDRSYGPPTS